MFQKSCSKISGIITWQFVATFSIISWKVLKRFLKYFYFCLKSIQKIFQEILLQRFENFTQNIYDNISVKKCEMLFEIFLK